MSRSEAIDKLMSVFSDRPQIIGDTVDDEWKARNAFVANIRQQGAITQKLRIKYDFFIKEFPILLHLAQYWAEAIYDQSWEAKVKKETTEELFKLWRDYPNLLKDEKARLAVVWNNKAYLKKELFPHGDTGEWYQIIFNSINVLGDPQLTSEIGLIFTVIVPAARDEIEERESKQRWTKYRDEQLAIILKQLNEAKEAEKRRYDGEVAIIRQKWSEAAAETKMQLLAAEEQIRDIRKLEIMRRPQDFIAEPLLEESTITADSVRYTNQPTYSGPALSVRGLMGDRLYEKYVAAPVAVAASKPAPVARRVTLNG